MTIEYCRVNYDKKSYLAKKVEILEGGRIVIIHYIAKYKDVYAMDMDYREETGDITLVNKAVEIIDFGDKNCLRLPKIID